MSATKELFKKFINPVFIETGSNWGVGIQQALDEGFPVVHSIEILPEFYNYCADKFKENKNVHLYLGDCVKVLPKILENLHEPATFWLDAHEGDSKSFLLDELNLIKGHKIKTHTILIDDLRCWNMRKHKFNTIILKRKLLAINPKYKITLEDGHVPDDILAARI
jgi:hypothetical protein